MRKYNFLTFSILCLSLCGLTLSWTAKNKAFQNSLAEQIVGEWRTKYVKVIQHTYHNTKETIVTEADSTNWETRFHMRAIRTYYKNDGTYSSEYRNLKDSIFRTTSGIWAIKGDSIILSQAKPEKVEYRLHLKINKNVATFKGWIDFDGDGFVDDDYTGIQKKNP